ncbi:MAG TPA: hypothetical protein VGO67_04200 [Verrucomicrobiae bacterium]|jgi:hypothetical protein
MKHLLLLGVACVALALPSFGQTLPSNDNFANRTVLTGNSVAFSGTLAGATTEPNEAAGGFFSDFFTEPRSVWWTWTATKTSLVTIEMTGASQDSGGFNPSDGMFIYNTTNLNIKSTPMAEFFLDLSFLCDAVTFSATEGTSYQFQMLGNTPTAYQFQLTASDAPLILQAPRNLTVSSNGSTLFTVVAEGYRPLSYQWQFAGTNLPGQTVAMLALTNIDGSQAGSYTVVVTNIGGAVTSAPAMLFVSSSNVSPILTAMPGETGQFGFGLTGEVGRYYRIESSVDLVNWTNDYTFPRHIYSNDPGIDFDNPKLTSVVFNTNGSSLFSVSSIVAGKFLRASQYQPANEICINNLRQIRFAKALWLRDDPMTNGQARSDTLVGVDIQKYFLNGNLPHCPLDTSASWDNSYNAGVGSCDSTPGCQIDWTNHILEEPQ